MIREAQEWIKSEQSPISYALRYLKEYGVNHLEQIVDPITSSSTPKNEGQVLAIAFMTTLTLVEMAVKNGAKPVDINPAWLAIPTLQNIDNKLQLGLRYLSRYEQPHASLAFHTFMLVIMCALAQDIDLTQHVTKLLEGDVEEVAA